MLFCVCVCVFLGCFSENGHYFWICLSVPISRISLKGLGQQGTEMELSDAVFGDFLKAVSQVPTNVVSCLDTILNTNIFEMPFF